jgi:hypothetical protein
LIYLTIKVYLYSQIAEAIARNGGIKDYNSNRKIKCFIIAVIYICVNNRKANIVENTDHQADIHLK